MVKQLFIFLITGFLSAPAMAVKYCNFGADPFDKNFMAAYDGPTGWMPAESTVRMRGKHSVYYCKLREQQLVALHPENGEPVAFVTCGNPILDYSVPQEYTAQQAPAQPRTNTLLELAKRPMGQVRVVDGTNPKARLTAEQFKFRANVGLSANWHFGLPETNIQQHQNVGVKNHNNAHGGSSSSRVVVKDGGGRPKNPPQGPPDDRPVNPPQGPPDDGPVNPPQGPVNPPN